MSPPYLLDTILGPQAVLHLWHLSPSSLPEQFQVLDKVQALLLLGGTDQTGEQTLGAAKVAEGRRRWGVLGREGFPARNLREHHRRSTEDPRVETPRPLHRYSLDSASTTPDQSTAIGPSVGGHRLMGDAFRVPKLSPMRLIWVFLSGDSGPMSCCLCSQ